MGKHNAIAEILNQPFRWPMQGDEPFVEAENPIDDAMIAENDLTRLVLMIDGYKEAADLVVAKTVENRALQDSLVYPAIFNYRQFIELSLKYLIATYGPHVGVKAIWNSHDLEKLWIAFEKILDRFGTDDPDEADPIVASVIGQFAKIDPKSDAYRYPVDQKGAPLPIAFARTHLENLSDVMKALEGYFSGCDGYLGHLIDAAP